MAALRVLLTGSTGFIGRHCIAPLLAANGALFATYRKHVPPAIDGVTWIKSDLLQPGEPEALISRVQPDLLLHLAWYVEPGQVMDHPDNVRWVMASLDLLRHFREKGGTRCVYCGSCFEYDWRFGYCCEDITPTQPDTLYGASKKGLSEVMLEYCRTTGLSGAWARPFFLYGPYENPRRLVPAVIQALLGNAPARSSHGLQIRDYMHVQDAADGIVALLQSEAQGIYNLASGQATEIRSIVERIGEIVGRPELLRIGAIPARRNDAPLVVGSPEKMERDTGWRNKIPLRSGLESTVDWWRNVKAKESTK